MPLPGREEEIPRGYELSQNFPNPFNPSTSIRFATENVAQIDVIVYDVLGRLVARLARGEYYPGRYSVVWDGRNDQGLQMPSGMYYIRMTAAGRPSGGSEPARYSAVRKMVMMK